MVNSERIQIARREFMRIAERAGLPEPDEVHYFDEEEELEFIWHEQKLAVIVELDEHASEEVPEVPF